MLGNVIGKTPEFTEDGSISNQGIVKEVTPEKTGEEKETPEDSSTLEKPAEEQPIEEVQGDDAEKKQLDSQVQGLSDERQKLLKEIQDLRGQRRQIKEEQLKTVESKMDDLKDVHPEDVTLIERILKSKGYVSKDEVKKLQYEEVKQLKLNEFLEKYPEFKPENDPQDLNWSSLQRELAFYRMPEDPYRIPDVLERARRSIASPGGLTALAEKQKLKTAGAGAGGKTVSPSSFRPFNRAERDALSRGGYTDEEIENLEKKRT